MLTVSSKEVYEEPQITFFSVDSEPVVATSDYPGYDEKVNW